MAQWWQKKREAPNRARVASNPAVFPIAPGAPASAWRAWLLRVLLIAGVTLWIYWPALRGGFVWDDGWYITTNPLLHNLKGLWKFWFQPGSWVEYYPIQETVLWLQWHLWGTDTLGYHLTNVILHIVNALLVWHLLSKFGLRLAWLGGLIFAVHPAQVDSVANISELKNVLSLPCFLLSMCKWIDYEESRSKRDYRKALGLFFVAMLCKISMAPFPAIILLYAWWKRGRIEWSDVKACAPFLLVALVLSFISISAGIRYEEISHGQIISSPLGGVFSRIDAAGLIATVYFARVFLPADVLFVYPQWPLHPGSLIEYMPWLVLAGVVYVLWSKRRSWGRHVLFGLGFFLIMPSPFLGFLEVSYMNVNWVFDHFLYIPIIGLIGLVVAGLGDLDTRIPALTRPFVVGVVALMAWTSHTFAGIYVNEATLWSYTLQRNPNFWLAHHNLGCDLLDEGRYQEAIAHFNEALRLRPDFGQGYYNLGLALEKSGRIGEAQEQYRKSMKLNPNDPNNYLNLGEIMKRNGNLAEAEALFRQGLKIEPDDASLCTDLGGILLQMGRVSEAINLYERVVKLDPDVAQLQYNLGVALLRSGSFPEAVEHLEKAVTLDPKIAAAHENLGSALAQSGRLAEAIGQFEAAVRIDPGYVIARDNLGLALAQTGRVSEAIDQFQQVLRIDPNNANARESLAKLQQFKMQQSTPAKP